MIFCHFRILIIVVITKVYGNNKPQDILHADFELVSRFNLNILLTPGRTNGVHSMLNDIKKYAETFTKKT